MDQPLGSRLLGGEHYVDVAVVVAALDLALSIR